MMRALLFLVVAAFAVSACGFSPVYGAQARAGAAPIEIVQIDGRTGHFLRQQLVRTVGPGLPGVKQPARLEITISEGVERLGFQVDQAASRSDFVATATYFLYGADGSLLAKGELREQASFNFADSAYADIASQTEAQKRVSNLLARTLREDLILKTSRPAPTAAPAGSPAP